MLGVDIVDSVLEHRIKVLEEKVSSMDIRLEKIDTDVINIMMEQKNSITELIYEIKSIGREIAELSKAVNKQDERISCLEQQPGKVAIKGWVFIISSIGTAILTLIFGLLFKGV